MPRAHIYIRVSTEDQQLGPEAQRDRCCAYVMSQAWSLVELYEDIGISGKEMANRPAFQRMLSNLRPGDRIVVLKLDRLSRNPIEAQVLIADLYERDIFVCSVSESIDTGTPLGKLMAAMMSLFAGWERERIAERTREALAVRKKRGEHVGCIPRGHYRGVEDRKLHVDHGDEDMQLALELIMNGHGVHAVATEFARRGKVNPRTGRPYSPSSFQYLHKRYRRVMGQGNVSKPGD